MKKSHLTTLIIMALAVGICPENSASGAESYSFVAAWPKEGSEVTLDSPRGIAVDSSGNIFVSDNENHRILKFDSSGKFLTEIGGGSADSAEGRFDSPWGVAVDASGNVYVTDTDNNRIQKFREETPEIPPETMKEVPAEPTGIVRPTEKRKLSVDNVVLLKELGIEEETILNKIQDSGTVFSVEEVEKLRGAGLSDETIEKLPKAGKKKPKLTAGNIILLHELGLTDESILEKIEETASTFSAEEAERLKAAGLTDAFIGKLTLKEAETVTKEVKGEKTKEEKTEKKEEKREQEEEKEKPGEEGLAGFWKFKGTEVEISLVLGEDGNFSWHYESGKEVEDLKGTWKQRHDETLEIKEENNPLRTLIPCKLVDADTLQITLEGMAFQFKREE